VPSWKSLQIKLFSAGNDEIFTQIPIVRYMRLPLTIVLVLRGKILRLGKRLFIATENSDCPDVHGFSKSKFKNFVSHNGGFVAP